MRNQRCSLTPIVVLVLAVVGPACIDRTVAEVAPSQTVQETVEFPVEMNRNLDLLFVIDNSRSMEAEQISLANNFGTMIDVFETIDGGLPNIHVGVISTDMGSGGYGADIGCASTDDGALQSAPRIDGCSPPSGAYISNVEGVANYAGTLSDTFACIARLGRNGCGFEQPLASLRKALDGSVPQNAGFLREDALLAIVFITDEDDCSVHDPSMFGLPDDPDSELGARSSFRCFEFGVECDNGRDPRSLGPREVCGPSSGSPYMTDVNDDIGFIKGLKRSDGQILVAGIVGNPGPITVTTDPDGLPCLDYSCGTATTCGNAGVDEMAAVPPVRLLAFMNAFPRKSMTTICDEDLTDALYQIAQAIKTSLDGRCISGNLADIDEDSPGIQPNCVASELRYPGSSDEVEVPLPQCDNLSDPQSSSNLPCFTMWEDEERCGNTPTQLRVEVFYPLTETVPFDTLIKAYCEGA